MPSGTIGHQPYWTASLGTSFLAPAICKDYISRPLQAHHSSLLKHTFYIPHGSSPRYYSVPSISSSTLVKMMIILLVYLAVTACALTPNRAGTLQIRNDYESRNLDTISNIYNMTIFPNNLPVLKDGAKAVPPGLFNINATGRVTPIGNFSGFDDSIEYFFALAPVAGQNNLNTSFFSNDSSAVIREAKVVEFASGCPEIAASTVYLAIGMVNGSTSEPIGDLFTTLKQASFVRMLLPVL